MKLIYLLTILFINTCLSLEPPHYDYIIGSLNYKTNFRSNLNNKITKDFKYYDSNIFNSELKLLNVKKYIFIQHLLEFVFLSKDCLRL